MADFLQLSSHAGEDKDGSSSAEHLCLVEKVEREAGQRDKFSVEVLVNTAMKNSGDTFSEQALNCLTIPDPAFVYCLLG